MAAQGQSEQREETVSRTNGGQGSRSLMFEGGPSAPAVTWDQTLGATWRPERAKRPSLAPSVAEAITALSGVALALFMLSHMVLLFTVLLGSNVMNDLAEFLEGYYLLHAATPFLVAIIAVHVFLTMRRAPTTFRQQQALARGLGRMGHFDTYTWAFQVVSGVALLALAALHLWVILSTLPIKAELSGFRVNDGNYLWLYIPFILLVEAHMSLGIYRLAVKWGILERHRTHLVSGLWTIVILAVGFTILAKFFSLGG